jgi:hypothetical protein
MHFIIMRLILQRRNNLKTDRKGVIFISLLLLSAMLAMPASAHAYQNEFNGYIGSSSGGYSPGDTDYSWLGYGLFYTRYLTDILTDDSPFGAREFLQHPSKLGAGLAAGNWEMEDHLTSQKYESGSYSSSIGVMYYLGGGHTATGLGLTLSADGSDTDHYTGGALVKSEDMESKGFGLDAHQYLARGVRLEATYQDKNAEATDSLGSAWEYDESSYSLGASALIDNIYWVSGRLEKGKREQEGSADTDTQDINLVLGMYPAQKTGVFLYLQKINMDYGTGESDVTNIGIEGDHYFNENLNLHARLIRQSSEYSMSTSEYDGTTLQAMVGYRF